jgi:hypothetical protein
MGEMFSFMEEVHLHLNLSLQITELRMPMPPEIMLLRLIFKGFRQETLLEEVMVLQEKLHDL